MIAKPGIRTALGSFGVLTLVLMACSGSTAVGSQYVKSATIGTAGGSIAVAVGDNSTIAGTTITIPKGALKGDTVISIGISTESVASSAPKGSKAAGPVIDFEPSGTTFLTPRHHHRPGHVDERAVCLGPLRRSGRSRRHVEGAGRQLRRRSRDLSGLGLHGLRRCHRRARRRRGL